MTEHDWLTCRDLAPMLHFVRLRATPQQLRLFACACCRLVWEQLPCDECRTAVELGERYAEDLLPEAERATFRRRLNQIIVPMTGARGRLAQAAADLLRPRFSPLLIAERTRTGSPLEPLIARQADLLRAIVGSPFGRPHP